MRIARLIWLTCLLLSPNSSVPPRCDAMRVMAGTPSLEGTGGDTTDKMALHQDEAGEHRQ